MTTRRLPALAAALALVAAACANPPATTAPSATSAPPAQSGAPTTEPSASAAPSTGYAELDAALAGEYAGADVTILSQWIEGEGEAFDDSLQEFRDATGINLDHEGISNYETVLGVRVEGGDAPDIAQIAQPGTMQSYQADGKLVDLSSILDTSRISTDFNPSLVDLATVDGKLYGLFYKQDLKSIVWYPVQAFEAKGYTVPTTWDELVALSDRIVADGSSPWCTTIEHGDASGWVATDWLEDILLRTAPLETYDKWIAHEVPFNDPAVVNAANLMAEMWFKDGYTFGGSERINGTWVGDSQSPMFDPAGPKCWLHKQAAWIPDFWPKDGDGNPQFTPGEDSAFFYFPEIDPQYGKPVLGGGDMFVVFNDRPEVRAAIQWLSTVDAVDHRVEAGGFLAANNSVPAELYKVYPQSGLAEIARNATALRFDASDSMPKEVGAGSFWKGMVKWVAQNGDGTQAILDEIEASWP
ncbi:MAG TPA: ABC transporter substrate-binding protein [Candidatus Limnocylindrales bacterium]|nr:ABC transporter substrate-binding protein [Candidatus Limnocylindrales bacterium]